MSQTAIQNDLNAIANQQVPVSAQFDDTGYAVLFEPGTYGTAADPLVFQVGYYEQVAGLGLLPSQTIINGQVEVFANTEASGPDGGSAGECYAATCNWANSTDNFWRSLSNLELNVMTNGTPAYTPAPLSTLPPIGNTYADGCFAGTTDTWSVSQAAPLRRVLVNGNIVFQQFCSETNYQGADFASGGFIADSQVSGALDFYGQQQYFTRNSDIGSAAGAGPGGGGLWNEVYSGVNGAPAPMFSGQSYQNTVIATNRASEEQPYLYFDGGNWRVWVPTVLHNSVGTSWSSSSPGPGYSVSLPVTSANPFASSPFFVANPSTPVSTIDLEALVGKSLILTPGTYAYNAPIAVTHNDSIVMGLGFPILVPQHGNAALLATSNEGARVSGLILDAGPVNSPFLFELGNVLDHSAASVADPDLASDVFFRVGGAETTNVSADISFYDFAPNSILDDIWAWRADHGQGPIGWTDNQGQSGLVVDADNVTATGLFVEHYQKNEVVWLGNGGEVEFFQNELPYDVPTQSAWMENPSQDGYPAFLVTPNVTSFNSYGMGSYVVFINTPATIYNQSAFEVPTAPGVHLNNTLGVYIGGSGGDQNLINTDGVQVNSVTPGTVTPVDVATGP